MHRNVERRLKVTAILAMLSGYLALTTTFNYGTDILLVPLAAVALMPLGERLDRRFASYRRLTTVLILFFIAVFFMILRRFSLLDAVIALVMFIQVYSLVHVKEPKNYIHLFLMSFFLVLAAAVMSPRPDIAAVFFLFIVSTLLGLTLLEMFSVASNTTSGPQWRSSSGEILAARKVRVFDFRFSILVVATLFGLFAFATVLFVGGPRTEAGVFGAARMPEQQTTGLSSEVDLSQAGALAPSQTPVMRVVFPERNGGQFNGPMLWRVTALDTYTGGGWQHHGVLTTGYSTEELRRFKSESRRASNDGIDRPPAGWPIVNYEIFLDRPPEIAVPLLQMPIMVKASDESPRALFRWDIANDFSVVLTTRGENAIYLEASSELISPTNDQLRSSPQDYSRAMRPEDYDILVEQDLLPATKALVDRLTRNEPTAYEKIMALQQHLQGNQFEYTRLIPPLPKRNPVDDFILNVREGHCQLFASALALMTRSLGLPARLVSGYRGGTWSDSDNSYTVTEDMAHVWVEVYFTGLGWITFDPSPMDVQPDGFSVNMITSIYNQYVMRARMLWLRNVVSFDRDRQGRSLQESAKGFIRSGLSTWEGLQSRDRQVAVGAGMQGVMQVLFLGLGLVVLAWALFYVRSWAVRRDSVKIRLTPDQRRAVRLRARMVRRLQKLGISVEGCTAEELGDAAAILSAGDADAIVETLTVYNAARFGQRPFSGQELTRLSGRIAKLGASQPVRAG